MAQIPNLILVKSEIVCSRCGFEYAVVHPVTSERVECPKCQYLEQIPPIAGDPDCPKEKW